MNIGCFQSMIAKRLLLWYILVISLVTLILSWDIVLGCSLVLVGPVGQKNDLQAFGLFKTAVYDEDGSFLGCVDYSQYWQDQTAERTFGVARVFGGLLAGTTTLACFVALLVQCFNKHGKTWLWNLMTWCYAIAFFSQLFIFAAWGASICESFEGKESECTAGSNSISSLLNFIFLTGMVVASFNSLPPRNPVFRCWYSSSDNSKIDTDSDMSDDIESQNDNVSLFTGRKQSVVKTVEKFESGQIGKPIPVPRQDPPVQNTEIERMFNKIMLKNTDGTEKFGLRKISTEKPEDMRSPSNQPSFLSELKSVQLKSTPTNAAPPKTDSSPPKPLAPPRSFFISPPKSNPPAVEKDPEETGKNDDDKKSVSEGIKDRKIDPSESVVAKKIDASGTIAVAAKKIDAAPSAESSVFSAVSDGSETATVETTYLLDQLAKDVKLKAGGKRISETRIGERLQIVDEYPVPSDFPTRNANRAMAGIVKVRTEYLPQGRKTIKEEFKTDGSSTVITILDPTNPTA